MSPCDYSIYPKNWKKIRAEIMARAEDRCECVGECGLHKTNPGPRRCVEKHGDKAIFARGSVFLTTAHLCHDSTCSIRKHLKAFCQRCHNRYDRPYRNMNRFKNRIHGDIEQRVLARGEFDDLDRCWEWIGCLSNHGYGKVRIEGKTGYVHRFIVAWVLKRPLLRNEFVDHLCRNRKCFRPSHLELVSPAENTRRGVVAKLTLDKICEIRRLRKSGVGIVEIGKMFKVNSSHISRISNGLVWKDKNAALTRDRKKGQMRLGI